jgi:hypothetical protein
LPDGNGRCDHRKWEPSGLKSRPNESEPCSLLWFGIRV